MSEKECTKCRVVKPFERFCNNSRAPDGKQSICKLCQNINSRRYRKTKNGVIKDIYSGQRRNSLKRGHNLPLYSVQELREWIIAQPVFHNLYYAWVQSGYDKWVKPSCDRKDDSQGYSFTNMQIITWFENSEKGRTGINRYKPVSQMSAEGNYIQTYPSSKEAGCAIGVAARSIRLCCNGKKDTSGNYKWMYSIGIPIHNNEVK